MFDMIKSTPAKICLLVTALVTFVYSMNFMLFADCYVTGGADGCFTILSNETSLGMNSWGNGGPETAFNGTMMFGIFISTMIILNEGAKGMWRTMIPVMIGLVTMTAVIWINWTDTIDSSETPKFVVPIVTLIYIAAYFLLRSEDEVDEGLSDFKPGLNIEDKPALLALLVLVVMGAFYCLRAIVTPESTIESYEYGALAEGLGQPSAVTVAVGGSLFLVYLLWMVLTIMEGAKGKWAIIHPGIFWLMAVVISNYVWFLDNLDLSDTLARPVTDQSTMDGITGPVAMSLLLLAYYRLRSEGIEDGMTFNGESMSANDFNIFAIMWAIGLGIIFTANMMMG